MTPLLEVKDLKVAYGKIEAVKGISFTVAAGEVVTLIGTNGAGKTTTLRTISGLLKPLSGSITFDGLPLTGTPAHKIVALGLAHSPEGLRYLPPAHHRREPSARCLPPQGHRRHQQRHRALLRPLPHPQGAQQTSRGHPFRR